MSEDKQRLYTMYMNTQNYLNQMGLDKTIPKCVRYYEGKQWPTATEETLLLPRPVVNISKFISKNKKAGVVNTPVKIVFQAEDGSQTQDLNDFHEYIMDEIKQKDVDKKAIGSGVKKGTYVYHYYWNKSKTGADALAPGGIDVETLEIMNVGFANPAETDEQKQKWIIITTREEVDAVKEIARIEGQDPDSITADTNESPYQEIEQEGTDYVTVFTRYFKKDGEVFFEKETKNGATIQEARALTPDFKAAYEEIRKREADERKASGVEDEAETGLQGAENGEANYPTDKFDLYPIVVGQWEERENSIFGIGEVEETLANQDIINRNLAYYLKARRDMSLGGWMVKEGALEEGEEISNAPDQVIKDLTAGNTWGIKELPTRNIPNDNLQFVDVFLNMIRTVTGATEVMSGEVLGKNMSGAAIAQLQNQAQQPLEEYRQRFWAVKEKQALVLVRFYRLFYGKTVFNRKENIDGQEQIVKKQFDPQSIQGKKIDVVAIAGQGSSYNELSTITALDNLLTKGVIDAKFYIQALPDKVLGNKDDLIKYLNEREQSQIVQLTQQNEQMQGQLEKAAEILSEQDQMVKKASVIVAENKRLQETIINMAVEYQQAIGQAKQLLTEAQSDATMFAQEIDRQSKERTAQQGK